MNRIRAVYDKLFVAFGSQGWWPILNNKTLLCEYHKNAPRNEEEAFEICIGAILTQSTSWKNVEKALINLKKNNALAKKELKKLSMQELAKLIKPAGYFNQKAKKIKNFVAYKGKITREGLLSIWGCGNETVDSMLLYAFNKPVFVVDAYTKRIMGRLGVCKENMGYEELQSIFHRDLKEDVHLFNEYHALLVKHAKQHCRTKPLCSNCPLGMLCKEKSAQE